MLTRNKLHTVAAVLAGMAALAPIQSAAAQDRPVFVYGEPESLRVEHVRFADLDLKAGGARKLESRVAAAVKRVCLFDSEIKLQQSGYHACAIDSWGRAQPQIDRAIARAQALALGGQPAATSATIMVAAQ